MIVVTAILVLIGSIIFGAFLYKKNNSGSILPQEAWLRKHLCRSRSLALYIQSLQFDLVFEELEIQLREYHNYQNFIHTKLGALSVLTSTNLRGYASVILYQNAILKDFLIGKIFYKYAMTDGRVFHCSPNSCESNYVTGEWAGHEQPQQKYFVFTYIRNPITRFISGTTEIEYRMSYGDKERKRRLLGFKHKVGDPKRFQEFVKMMAYLIGKGPILRNLIEVQIEHVAPQIGTILLMCNAFNSSHGNATVENLSLYKIENFSKEWDRMVNESGYTSLASLYKTVSSRHGVILHPTADDPLRTTLAGMSFLSYANEELLEFFRSKLNNNRLPIPDEYSYDEEGYSSIAKTYLRVICRIYLVDFICADYHLPSDCSTLLFEVAETLHYELESLSESEAMRKLRLDVCCNASLVGIVQMEQLRLADLSVTDPADRLPNVELNMSYVINFYSKTFGSTNLLAPSKNDNFQGLSYQRIYKNANDYIRTLLFKHAFSLDGGIRRPFYCIASQCEHERVRELSHAEALRNYPSHSFKRFPFVFSQHPIDRFIQTIVHLETNNYKNPLPGAASNIFEQYVTNLLINNVSNSIKPYFASFLHSHFLAMEVEMESLHIYNAENIFKEWDRLSTECTIPYLFEYIVGLYDYVAERKNYSAFNILLDAFASPNATIVRNQTSAFCSLNQGDYSEKGNETAAVGAFVAYHWPIAVGAARTEVVCLPTKKLRALCRLYLFDFIYFKYPFPDYCSDIVQEAGRQVEEYLIRSREANKQTEFALLDPLRKWVPTGVLKFFSWFACWQQISPVCQSEFVYGKNVLDDGTETEEANHI